MVLGYFQTSKAKKLGYFTHHDHGGHNPDNDEPKSDESDDESDSEKVNFLSNLSFGYFVRICLSSFHSAGL